MRNAGRIDGVHSALLVISTNRDEARAAKRVASSERSDAADDQLSLGLERNDEELTAKKDKITFQLWSDVASVIKKVTTILGYVFAPVTGGLSVLAAKGGNAVRDLALQLGPAQYERSANAHQARAGQLKVLERQARSRRGHQADRTEEYAMTAGRLEKFANEIANGRPTSW